MRLNNTIGKQPMWHGACKLRKEQSMLTLKKDWFLISHGIHSLTIKS